MINFLDPKLLPSVSTAAAAMDGYEAANLLSPNHVTRARGFVAFTSIKPPVNINFTLICPIRLNYVSIQTKVGTQKCTAIELLVKGPNQNDFTSIAQLHYIEEGVIFCNSRYYSKQNPPINVKNYQVAYLKSYTFRSFINAKDIQVRILRTEWSVPCLGIVEIWGDISKMCPETTVKTVNKLLNRGKVKESTSVTNVIGECDTKFDFPEDFKDALTYEIMAIPMTLPSGHTVDKSTLEKCIGNDSNYGRQAGDPFTGLPFTGTRKPVLNVGLKTRIDMYLLQNAHRKETFSVGRTIGVKRKVSELQETPETIANKRVDVQSSDEPILTLEEAIAKVTNSKNFISFTANSNQAIVENKNECVSCKVSTNLYSLLCNHLFCRSCLLDISKDLICRECKRPFLKNHINKFHTMLFE